MFVFYSELMNCLIAKDRMSYSTLLLKKTPIFQSGQGAWNVGTWLSKVLSLQLQITESNACNKYLYLLLYLGNIYTS